MRKEDIEFLRELKRKMAECLSLGLSLRMPTSAEMVDEQAIQDQLDLEEYFR